MNNSILVETQKIILHLKTENLKLQKHIGTLESENIKLKKKQTLHQGGIMIPRQNRRK